LQFKQKINVIINAQIFLCNWNVLVYYKTGNARVIITFRRFRLTTTNITYAECVYIAFGIWHAKRMQFITLSPVACLAGPYFSVLCHKRHDFLKDVLEHKTCILICCTTSVWNISHSKKISASYCHKWT
jgi:hypothetical protein